MEYRVKFEGKFLCYKTIQAKTKEEALEKFENINITRKDGLIMDIESVEMTDPESNNEHKEKYYYITKDEDNTEIELKKEDKDNPKYIFKILDDEDKKLERILYKGIYEDQLAKKILELIEVTDDGIWLGNNQWFYVDYPGGTICFANIKDLLSNLFCLI